MRHLSLFSGIGGFDLAARWMGWENVAHVEKNAYCRKILKQHFPKSKSYEDIKKFNGQEYAGTIDIISGGFPCQPFSVAGKQKGKSDDRHLWPEMLRVIREVKPRWIVGENVTGIVKLALDDVLTSLEDAGYITETYIIPACAVGAWHRRDRVWIVANRDSIGRNSRRSNREKRHVQNNRERNTEKNKSERCERVNRIGQVSKTNPNANGERCENRIHGREKKNERKADELTNSCKGYGKETWATEPGVGRLANGFPGRVDRIKALGNAIVPQVAYEIFKAIDIKDNELFVS